MNNSYNVENGKADDEPTWWERRSKLERRLTILSAVAIVIILILIIVIIIYFTHPSQTCLTLSCVHTANELLVNIDTSINPCDDFYQFTCGNYLANTQLDGEPSRGIDTLMYDNINNRIQGIIEEPEFASDPRSVILGKRLYKACLNQTAIEDRSLKLIKDSLRQIGGWPILEGSNWKDKNFDWKAVTYKLRELGYGFEFFIQFRIEPDKEEPSRYMIELQKPYSSLENSDDKEEEEFLQFMVNISMAFGADRNRAKNEFRDVIDFQKELFKDPSEFDSSEEKYNPLTISELIFQFREIPWMEYINRLQFPAPNITHDQTVSVPNTAYFLRLQNALKRTPKRVLANYIAWRTVRETSLFLSMELWDLANRFYYEENGKLIPPRPKMCSHIVQYNFPLALQAAYVRKYFSAEAKSHVSKLLQTIKDEFKEVITQLKWMDEETRTKALERLASSSNYVAYPPELMDDTKIEERYMGFQVDQENFLSSLLNVRYYTTNQRFQKLHEPVQKDQELEEAYTTYVHSYYSPSDNTITIPTGLLHGLIYDNERPQYLNYGALGSIVGHEVFHTVFEGKGCQKQSKYYDWLTTHTLMNFSEKLSCVTMHYGKYPVPEIGEHLNSSNTKNEDIADIAGAQLAYRAYKNWERSHGSEQSLPGLDYTPKQLFWISTAVRFCKKSTPAALESSVGHSYTSPSKFRALGILRNSDDFAKDFNCPATSYMNNEEKCNLW